MQLRSMKAGQVLKLMFQQGWVTKRSGKGSHLILQKADNPSLLYSWSFHDNETIGKPMLAKLVRKTGIQTEV